MTDKGHKEIGQNIRDVGMSLYPEYFTQKAEKLSTAVYMITDIINDREPLRWKAREEAMDVLSSVYGILKTDASSRWNVLYRISQSIDRIINVLSLGERMKLISEMNARVVIGEYRDLKNRLQSSWNTIEEKGVPKLNHTHFKVERKDEVLPQPSFPQPQFYRTTSDKQKIGEGIQTHQSDNVRLIRPVSQTVNHGEQKDKKNDRKEAILKMLENRSDVSVSDVLKEIPGVSDKTIQRELVSMVENGVLLKKGEKRWSTYSLSPSAQTQRNGNSAT